MVLREKSAVGPADARQVRPLAHTQEMSYQRSGTGNLAGGFFWLIYDADFTIDLAQFPDRVA
jgi:hypothetical protein